MTNALKIKSPQLYRLSYRPYRGFVSVGAPVVSALYTVAVTGGSYHGPAAVSS